ncbi:MAG: YfcE family phosphodiesterase [Clostridia bacterium]|nr:YfcE family phosphodiesterase [Clostridia bacterium]
MKLLVISDSHGRADRIKDAFELNRDADYLIFLGDGIRNLEYAELGNIPIISVRGNCDLFGLSSDNPPPTELILNLGEYTLMIAHGHTLHVKEGLDFAISHAAKKGADILLFGHTHTRLDKYIPAGERIGNTVLQKPLRLFNPGSIGQPRFEAPSFGLIGIRGKDVLTSFGEL